jgi:glycosyltransferase involved in cell wall biosynthesis
MNENGSRKTKVLFVMRNLGKGGAEKVLSVLLNRLDRDRYEIACILYDAERVFDVPDDVKVYSLGIPGTRNFFKKSASSMRRIVRIKKIIEADSPDVVFSFINTVNVVSIIAVLLSGRSPKLVISERNTLSAHELGVDWIGKLLIKKMYPKAHRIIAVSEGVKQDLLQNFGLPQDKVSVIYNPVDVPGITSLSGEPVVEQEWFREGVPIILNVGSLSKKKGQKYLLEAFRIVNRSIPSRLVILGEGEEESELKRLAAVLGIEKDVAFLGFQANPYKFMAKSSVFVLSSLWEGLPNVILEAMACGVPVVSTDCPSGPNEIIRDGQNGLLVPVKNAERLGKAILRVLENRTLAMRISGNAYAGISRFSVSEIVDRYSEAILS